MYSFEEVVKADPELAKAMELETGRQNDHIELIASENFVSKAVMAAMGSTLTNKYAEGYPGKRYYGGCQFVDMVEELARERAKKLFGCTYVNVQPHSGAQANMAVFFALVKPGETVMGMNLDHGGHLSHGSPANISGTYYHIVPYGVNDKGFIDYDEVERIAKECKPKMIIAGASAYCRKIDFKRFREIADEVGAFLMVDMAHIAGLVASGCHWNRKICRILKWKQRSGRLIRIFGVCKNGGMLCYEACIPDGQGWSTSRKGWMLFPITWPTQTPLDSKMTG